MVRLLRSRVSLAAIGLFGAVALSLAAKYLSDKRLPVRLVDATLDSGITFQHTDGSTGQRLIVETVGAGLALFDYDNDGWIDVYLLNGARLSGSDSAAETNPPRNSLYRNLGGFRFTDVTGQSGLGDAGYGLGVAVADFDNDGLPDVFVNNAGPNALYHNNGDASFTRVAQSDGIDTTNQVGAGAAFFDMDRNGDLDLYVGNYLDFAVDQHRSKTIDGVSVYHRPLEYNPVPDNLYRNNGDGSFTDVSHEAGIASQAASGKGLVCADADDDGDADIFVANDVMGNFLFQNDGTGHFEQIALAAGLAVNADGVELGSTGVDCADYDNDGRLDFYVATFAEELPVLFKNLGYHSFQDATRMSGAGAGAARDVNWGTGFWDVDNDGDQDLFLACGHALDNTELLDSQSSFEARNILLLNNGDGTFVNVTDRSGDGMDAQRSSRGAGFDDLDNDGDLDVVVQNLRGAPTILRNDTIVDKHNWLQIQLHGVISNRDAVGARVKVVAGDLSQVAEVHSGRGYQSHFGSRLHFGIGNRSSVDEIQVQWPSGSVSTLKAVPVNRLLTIRETNKRVKE